MKKLHSGHALLFFGLFLAILFFIFFLSCASPKEILRETATTTTTTATEELVEKIPLTTVFLNSRTLFLVLYGSQLMSGHDTIKLEPALIPDATLGEDGKVVFASISPIIIPPHTLGAIIPNGIVVDQKTGKIKIIKVSFWLGREDLWIPFEPGTDSLGTFILSTLAISEKIENQIVPYGRWVVLNNNDLFEVKLGVGIENPLFIIFKWKEGQPKVAPGWNLNENLPQKK